MSVLSVAKELNRQEAAKRYKENYIITENSFVFSWQKN